MFQFFFYKRTTISKKRESDRLSAASCTTVLPLGGLCLGRTCQDSPSTSSFGGRPLLW